MKQQTKLTSGQQQEAVQHTGETQGKVFGSPEELLRFDAANSPVPAQVTEKINRSLASEPAPPAARTSWLRRLLGGSQ